MAKAGGTKNDSGFRITIGAIGWKQRGSARKRASARSASANGTTLVQNYKGYNRRYNIKNKFRFATNENTSNARADVVKQLTKKKIRSYQ